MSGSAGGPFTINGDGFAPGTTTVGLAGVDITASATITTTTISFPMPAPPPPTGTHAVEIVVNGVPCLPGPVVTL
jgi:hypothetical protein